MKGIEFVIDEKEPAILINLKSHYNLMAVPRPMCVQP
jgi:hypothetical protein